VDAFGTSEAAGNQLCAFVNALCDQALHFFELRFAGERADVCGVGRRVADLPPSSCVTRFTVGAAAKATAMPARVEPVKETIATSGCEAIAAPTVGPSPLTRLKTPVGTAASCRICAKR